MNIVCLMGRLARDPTISYTQAGETIAKFTLAVDRRKSREESSADFISCVAFKQSAELIEKWFHKGDPLALNGRIQTGSYTNKDGQKVYTTDVIVDHCYFVPSRGERQQTPTEPAKTAEGFMTLPEGETPEGIPFL